MEANESKIAGVTRCLAAMVLGAVGIMANAYAQAGYACQSASECSRMGEVAYKEGDYKKAIGLYESQREFAEDERTECEIKATPSNASACEKSITRAYNNLALANLRIGEPTKANMWLGLAPKGPSTTFNRRLIEAALTSVQWPASPEGEYWSPAGFGLWNSLGVRKEGTSFRITFDGFWMPPRGWMDGPNSGHASEVVTIRGGAAVFHQEDDAGCAITANFANDKVTLSESPACEAAFGANVHAVGEFVRVSSNPPD